MRGVISFVVASIFLLVLLSSAQRISARAPDYSYQPVVNAALLQTAVQAAFSDAMATAAGKALATASAAGVEAQPATKAALYGAALDFEAQMKEIEIDSVFWCGLPSVGARQAASESMASEGRAVVPQGALPLSNPLCADGFDVNLLRKTVRVGEMGFSLYSRQDNAGYAHALPKNYEIDVVLPIAGRSTDESDDKR
jgi:hypothetical protein